MGAVVIIHFSPLEQYPPVQNFINDLGSAVTNEEIVVISQVSKVAELVRYQPQRSRISIIRVQNLFAGESRTLRLLNYVVFNMVCIYHLVRLSPRSVLYYETLSSFPAYFYKRFLRRDVPVFIHYHEYTSPAEYRSGMSMVRWFHKLEQWLYPRAKWISQTNQRRLDLFQDDIAPVKILNGFVFPNYPPRSWSGEPLQCLQLPLRIVYAGALSMKTMYTREFAEWVLEQEGNVTWDIYAYNCTNDAMEYVRKLDCCWINLKGGVNYPELPEILRKYHVGVILYNGHIPNYIHNAPNKLFEYLACGLSVWFPQIMTGCDTYKTNGTVPQVLALDFNSLKGKKAEQLLPGQDAPSKKLSFCSELASVPLIHQLINDK